MRKVRRRHIASVFVCVCVFSRVFLCRHRLQCDRLNSSGFSCAKSENRTDLNAFHKQQK